VIAAPAPPSAANAPDEPDFAVPAGGDIYPRTPEEKRLCDKASSPDWLYLGGSVAAVVASVFVDRRLNAIEKPANLEGFYTIKEPGVRLIGPPLVGLSWGFLLGGMYLALPKCDPRWIGEAPREGSVRRTWPVALSLAALAGLSAPFFMGVEQGFDVLSAAAVSERQARVFLSAGLGFGGALLPYLLPPKTWRAAKKLETLRAEPYQDGAIVKYVVQF
jgi:hypothetical protein